MRNLFFLFFLMAVMASTQVLANPLSDIFKPRYYKEQRDACIEFIRSAVEFNGDAGYVELDAFDVQTVRDWADDEGLHYQVRVYTEGKWGVRKAREDRITRSPGSILTRPGVIDPSAPFQATQEGKVRSAAVGISLQGFPPADRISERHLRRTVLGNCSYFSERSSSSSREVIRAVQE